MPGLDGLELQTRLLAEGHRTPVIFVTAFSGGSSRRRAMDAGAVGFLSKPFHEDSLIKCVESALNASRNYADA
jgi:FixJ family two-component response regulator